MKTKELFERLDQFDRQYGKWLFTVHDLRILFPERTKGNFHNQLTEMVRNRYLTRVCRGVYANRYARSRPYWTSIAVAAFLRPRELIYVSRETRLSDLGFISQMMPDYLTLTTTGPSQLYKTCFGRVEFTHTKQQVHNLLPHLEYDHQLQIFQASAALAWKELKRSARNTDLVLEQVEKYDDVQLPS